MKNILGIARRELSVAFTSPLAYIVLGVFLLVTGIKFFYFPGVFVFGRASFRTFFDWMPAFLAVLAPALTMRMLAEEKKSGTLELLMTLPVRDHEIAIGKWLAGTGIIAIGLAFTTINAFLIAPLAIEGQAFDWGPVVGAYVGSVLLASAMVALGVMFSAQTRNQVIAFILATAIGGTNLLLAYAVQVMPASVGEFVQYLSAYYHFESLGRGVIDWRDVLFFVSLTAGLLLITTQTLTQHRRVGSTVQASTTTAFVLGVLVFVNLFAVRLPLRLDLTHDKTFTLAEATKETMKDLESPVTITAYFTKDLPPPFSDNARFVKDLLEEYRAVAGDNLSFSFVDPQAEETAEDKETKKDARRDIFGRVVREQTSVEKELEALGIQAVEVRVLEQDQQQTKRAWMGISVRFGEEQESLPVVQDISSLEYDLTTVIRRLTQTKRPVVGVIQGHGELNPDEQLQRLKPMMEQNYEVRAVTIPTGADAKIPDDVDAILVLGPKSVYSDDELKAVDAFVMQGKAAGFFLDKTNVDLRSFQPEANPQNLDSVLSAWGIELGSQLVGDVDSASLNVQEKRGMFTVQRPIQYPFIPTLKALQGDSPITRGIVGVTLPFAVPLYTKKLDGVEHTVLGKSSAKSWLEDASAEGLSPQRDWGTADVTVTGPYDLIVTAQGALPSFANAGSKAEKPARIFVVGTSTMLNEQVLGPPNASLLLNLVDWMVLDPKLLEMRSRGQGEAPFSSEELMLNAFGFLGEALEDHFTFSRRDAVKLFGTAGVPALLVLVGLVRWRLRESRRQRLSKAA